MSEVEFLAEVEDFLSSCDLPELHLTQTQEKCEYDRIPGQTSGTAFQQCKDKSQHSIDATAKRELEKAKDRKRRATYRERQRSERESLQLQVEELSLKLANLQSPKETSVSTAWKLVAQHQHQARLDAELQQRQLRAELDARLALVQEVCHRLTDMNEDDLDVVVSTNKRVRLEPCDGEFFNVFVQELGGIYAKTDKVLSARGVDSTEEDWGDLRRLWKEEVETGYFVYTNKRAMPITFHQCCKALWHAAHLPHHQEAREDFGGLPDPNNTSAFKYRVTNHLGSGQVLSVLQRCVIRRYEQNGRFVVVWRVFLEGEGDFIGMHADETGWVELSPSPGGGTLMRTCIHHVPMHLTRLAALESAVKEFTGVVLDSVSADGVEITKRFELLTEA